MTEEFINGYVECISRVKDIITPNLGGFNTFFPIGYNAALTVEENILVFLEKELGEKKRERLERLKKEMRLTPIENWEKNFVMLISRWTCDKELTGLNGRNGYPLSEYLVRLLKGFFNDQPVSFWKMDPDSGDWPWGDMMGDEYVILAGDKLYILHFGEST